MTAEITIMSNVVKLLIQLYITDIKFLLFDHTFDHDISSIS